MKIHIQGGRLIDPANGVDAVNDIYIAAGRVVGIGQAPAGFVPNRLVDARGLYPDGTHKLDKAYLDEYRPLAEQRVRQAAYRLALLLNETLGK